MGHLRQIQTSVVRQCGTGAGTFTGPTGLNARERTFMRLFFDMTVSIDRGRDILRDGHLRDASPLCGWLELRGRVAKSG